MYLLKTNDRKGHGRTSWGDGYTAYLNLDAWVYIGYKSLSCPLMCVDFICFIQCVLSLNKQTNK